MPDLRVEISDPPTLDTIHRFRNFGEDVYRAFRDRHSVDIGEIDASTKSFHVRHVHRRELRSVSKEIMRIATKHFFAPTASVVVVE